MRHVAFLCFAFLVSVAANVSLIASLVEERSTDKLRLTVHVDDLPNSMRAIRVACRCAVEAVPIGAEEDEADYWLLSFAIV